MSDAARDQIQAVLAAVDRPADGPARQRLVRQRAAAAAARARAAELAGAAQATFAHDERGAPLASGGWHWSTAHARALSAAVVARERVGIDVERPRPSRALELWLDARERALLANLPLERAVLLAWTAKEAALKRAGAGLAGLGRCRLSEIEGPEHWLLGCLDESVRAHFTERDGHVAAVALSAGSRSRVRWSTMEEPVGP